MNASVIIFYILSAFMLGTALLAVTTRKIFRSAIFLLFTLIGTASLFFWMGVEFVAAVQIIIYVGGIVVLIIFSIFLTQKSGEESVHADEKQSGADKKDLRYGYFIHEKRADFVLYGLNSLSSFVSPDWFYFHGNYNATNH